AAGVVQRQVGGIEEDLGGNLLLALQGHAHVRPRHSSGVKPEMMRTGDLEGQRIIVRSGATDPERMPVRAVEDAIGTVDGGRSPPCGDGARRDASSLRSVVSLGLPQCLLRGNHLAVELLEPRAGNRAPSGETAVETEMPLHLLA